jgi:Protein of unknown function (DUF1761)
VLLVAIASINPWAVLAAAVFCFVVGGVYYGALMTRPYAAVMGRAELPPETPGLLTILGPFLCNVVMILTTAVVLRLAGVTGLGDGLAVGLLIAVGYLLAMCLMIAINPNFPHPFAYTALNAPVLVGNMLVTCAILVKMG